MVERKLVPVTEKPLQHPGIAGKGIELVCSLVALKNHIKIFEAVIDEILDPQPLSPIGQIQRKPNPVGVSSKEQRPPESLDLCFLQAPTPY